ncbi:MAG: RNA-binding transcriptional accessory protein [Pseudoflavonifractor sp.]|nr:RNA-binding transcriptional accessory protein [Pseudoflavonifractor sp.]
MNLGPRQAGAIIKMLRDGATIPFIARYRKEATGSLDEVTLRNIQLRLAALDELEKRKATVIDTITSQGAMTDDLLARINECTDSTILEDIYLPYKPKRKTRASQARDKGLEPLAKMIMAQELTDLDKAASRFVDKKEDGVADIAAALDGASDIIAEWVNESDKARSLVRSRYQRGARISASVVAGKEEEGAKYKEYFNYSEALRLCPSHRYLAIRRAEEEGILKVDISLPNDDEIAERLTRMFVKAEGSVETAEIVRKAVKDSYKRLVKPSIVSEFAAAAKERSDSAAIALFADNVKQLLMEPPLGRKRVMGIDPGFRSGCKLACLDEQGNVLATETIYPTTDYYHSADALSYLIDSCRIDVIAVGNGTGSRDTVSFIESIQLPRPVTVKVVSEQGASVYSASDVAREEFPDMDITLRGAVSIGRRLLDPMAELVKIEPKSIGVGQYQHDVNQSALRDALDYTVESCVNAVGVNVNTASRQLLGYVSGIGPKLAGYIVDYRTENGPFKTRQELLNVPRMGEKAFQQCAGFLRIPGGENPLDNTGVHPERYPLLDTIAADMGVETERLVRDSNLYNRIELDKYATRKVGMPTLTDIILELQKPGRDPRTDNASPDDAYDAPGFVDPDSLHIGMELNGKVTNLTAFGVFVDIGLKYNGLIHVSQLSDQFVTSPADVVRVGQSIRVKVVDIDNARNRVALTLKGVSQL